MLMVRALTVHSNTGHFFLFLPLPINLSILSKGYICSHVLHETRYGPLAKFHY